MSDHVCVVADLAERYLDERGASTLDQIRAGIGRRRADVVEALRDESRFLRVERPGRVRHYARASWPREAFPAVPAGAPAATGDPAVAATLAGLDALAAAGRLTPTALILDDPQPDYGRLEALASAIGAMHDWSAWWAADLLVYAELTLDGRDAQLAEALRRSPSTLAKWAWVARHVGRRQRRASLSFSHHESVAGLDPDAQTEWLDRAEDRRWTSRELREQVRSTVSAGTGTFGAERTVPRPEDDRRVGDGRAEVEADLVAALAELRRRHGDRLDRRVLVAAVDAWFACGGQLFHVQRERETPPWA